MRRREFIAAGGDNARQKILVGFALGLAFGYTRDRHFGGFWDWFTTALNSNYPTHTGTGWGIFGAIVGAAVIYMAQLMRR